MDQRKVCRTCKHYKRLVYVTCKGECELRNPDDELVWANDQGCEKYIDRNDE